MRKTLLVLVLAAILLMVAGTTVRATTQAELLDYIIGTHKIAGKEVTLTSAEIKQAKDFFATHTISDEDAAFIKQKAEEAKGVLNRAGVIDVQKLSKEDKKELMKKAEEAGTRIGLVVDTTTGIVTDPATGEEVFVLPEGKLVQTGSNNLPYIIVAGVAIIAIAGTVVYKKVRA